MYFLLYDYYWFFCSLECLFIFDKNFCLEDFDFYVLDFKFLHTWIVSPLMSPLVVNWTSIQ